MSITAWVFFMFYVFGIGWLIGAGVEGAKPFENNGMASGAVFLVLLTIVCLTRAIVLMP